MSSCQICTNEYGGKVVPTTLTCCGEDTICFDCLEKDRVAKISNLTGNRKKIKCMLCNEEFHSVNDKPWVVNKTLIRLTGIEVDLSCVREAQAARQLASSTRKDVVSRRSQRNIVEQNSVALVGGGELAIQTSNANQASQNNESTETREEVVANNTSSSITTRSASRQKREASNENQLNIERQSTETHIESDEESRFSTVDEGYAARKRSKISVTASESLSSEDKDDLDDEDTNEDSKHWLDAVSKDINVYRVRIFKNDSLCNDDKFGRKSFWCIKNDYVASGANILIVDELRDKIRTGGLESVRDHIRDMDHDHLYVNLMHLLRVQHMSRHIGTLLK